MAKRSKTQAAKASARRQARKAQKAELAAKEAATGAEAAAADAEGSAKKPAASKAEPAKAVKKADAKKEKPKKQRFKFLHDVRSELRRVTWPTRQEVLRWTGVVVASLVFFGVFVAVLDNLVVTPIVVAISGLGAGA